MCESSLAHKVVTLRLSTAVVMEVDNPEDRYNNKPKLAALVSIDGLELILMGPPALATVSAAASARHGDATPAWHTPASASTKHAGTPGAVAADGSGLIDDSWYRAGWCAAVALLYMRALELTHLCLSA